MSVPNIFGLGPDAANYFGFAGMACIIFAYGYITAVKAPNPYIQHGVNLLGAALLAISLTVHTNMASMVLEAFWAAIAVWGLAKAALGKRSKA